MAREKTELVTLRLPVGLATEIRTLTGLPFNRIARILLITYRNQRKRELEQQEGSPSPHLH